MSTSKSSCKHTPLLVGGGLSSVTGASNESRSSSGTRRSKRNMPHVLSLDLRWVTKPRTLGWYLRKSERAIKCGASQYSLVRQNGGPLAAQIESAPCRFGNRTLNAGVKFVDYSRVSTPLGVSGCSDEGRRLSWRDEICTHTRKLSADERGVHLRGRWMWSAREGEAGKRGRGGQERERRAREGEAGKRGRGGQERERRAREGEAGKKMRCKLTEIRAADVCSRAASRGNSRCARTMKGARMAVRRMEECQPTRRNMRVTSTYVLHTTIGVSEMPGPGPNGNIVPMIRDGPVPATIYCTASATSNPSSSTDTRATPTVPPHLQAQSLSSRAPDTFAFLHLLSLVLNTNASTNTPPQRASQQVHAQAGRIVADEAAQWRAQCEEAVARDAALADSSPYRYTSPPPITSGSDYAQSSSGSSSPSHASASPGYTSPAPSTIYAHPRFLRGYRRASQRIAAVPAPAPLRARAVVHRVAAVPNESHWHGAPISFERGRLVRWREPDSAAGLRRRGVLQLRASLRHFLEGLKLYLLDAHDAGARSDADERGTRGTPRTSTASRMQAKQAPSGTPPWRETCPCPSAYSATSPAVGLSDPARCTARQRGSHSRSRAAASTSTAAHRPSFAPAPDPRERAWDEALAILRAAAACTDAERAERNSSPHVRLRTVVLPHMTLLRFLGIASANSVRSLETCGLLLGMEVMRVLGIPAYVFCPFILLSFVFPLSAFFSVSTRVPDSNHGSGKSRFVDETLLIPK
ncbi:hypothetical protein DFH09DRAFT_1279612 [Mycena vulgaris]|nr:hypothetical protein DFH09DRAFT_1279612 [Mycena vulgaris]